MQNKNVAFTITAKNRLPSAMVCRDTFKEYQKDTEFIIFLADQINQSSDIKLLEEAQPLICCNELKRMSTFKDTNKLEEMAYKYDVVEFCTSVKPFCIEYLMWSGYDKVLYFDPDIQFFNDCHQLYSLLSHNECILTPHLTKPMPNDGKQQTDKDILMCGIYNLGFGGWSLSKKVIDFIRWWQGKLKNQCFHDVNNHLFVDQIWMNFAPAFLSTYVIKNPTYNVAYWNLFDRQLEYKNDKWYVGDEPLNFYHFSGLDYFNPSVISRYQNRFTLQNRPEIAKLIYEYLQKIDRYDGLRRINLSYFYDHPYTSEDRKIENRKNQCNEIFQTVANPWVGDLAKTSNISDYGMNIIGYFPYTSGVAEVARHFVQKLYSTGFTYALHPIPISKVAIRPDEQKEFGYYYAKEPGFDTSIFFINLDQISKVHESQPELFKNRNIGVFWWEIENDLPFQENFQYIDEILCFTKFTQEIFTKFAPRHVKIHKLPYPFIIPRAGTFNDDVDFCKAKLGLKPEHFVFYFMFDYASSYERKNVSGLLRTFAQVHSHCSNSMLLLKTLNADLYPADNNTLDLLCKELQIDSNVIKIDGPLAKEDLYALYNMCDSYVSLHRSEGCGIGMIEAMSFGKPVIATGYGGNMEFMNNDNSLIVKHKLVEIKKTVFNVYRNGAVWAEPDLNDATDKMINIVKDNDFRSNLSMQAKQFVVEYADMQKFNRALYEVMSE